MKWSATYEPKALSEIVARVQFVDHQKGVRIYLLRGTQGLYDNWRRVDTSDHTPPVVAELLDTDFEILAQGGYFSAISATYEGGWAAWWRSLNLANYVIGRIYDSSIVGLTVDGVNGNTITQGLMDGYHEESGPVVVSREMNVVCYYNRFSRHGGTSSGLKCQGLSDQGSWWGLVKNRSYVEGVKPDNLNNGGVALAKATNRVVATLNYDLDDRKARNGLYAWKARTAATEVFAFHRENSEWSAPSVGPEGRFAYATVDGNVLVEMDTLTGSVRLAPLDIGSTSLWPFPPIVTQDRVIVVQTRSVEHGDLVAYDRQTLERVWRLDAGIRWHENALSGWSATDDFPAQCGEGACLYGGYGALRAVDHRTGQPIPWLYADLREGEYYYNPQLWSGGVMVQVTKGQFECAPCEARVCVDGKPVGSTDYSPEKCCAGVTRRCPNVDCSYCERVVGFCPHDDGRRCLVYPGRRVEMLKFEGVGG